MSLPTFISVFDLSPCPEEVVDKKEHSIITSGVSLLGMIKSIVRFKSGSLSASLSKSPVLEGSPNLSSNSSITISALLLFLPEYEPFSLYRTIVSIIAGTSNFNLEILNFLSSKRGIVLDKKGTVAPSKKIFTIPFLKCSLWWIIFAI